MPDSYVDELINQPDPFNFSREKDQLFFQAMKESFLHHYNNCEVYKKICHLDGFLPEFFESYQDIFFIPHFFVSVLKKYSLKSIPKQKVKLTLTSSGTSGQKSVIYLDRITLERIRKIVWNIYDSYGMADRSQKVNCILFSYEYEHASQVGTAFSDKLLSSLTGIRSLTYALKYDPDKQDFYLDVDGVIDALIQYNQDDAPLRIIGFPAFLYEIYQVYNQRDLPQLEFGDKSFIITGGGWKTKADNEIPTLEFKMNIARWLKIPSKNVRDLFGMVEHGVPYCECESGNLHVPNYSRAVARDPGSLRIVPDGQPGLLHLYTPYLHSFPAISLLTSDLGTTGRNCPCGRNAPYISVLGRAGKVKHKGCAIQALDYLQ